MLTTTNGSTKNIFLVIFIQNYDQRRKQISCTVPTDAISDGDIYLFAVERISLVDVCVCVSNYYYLLFSCRR